MALIGALLGMAAQLLRQYEGADEAFMRLGAGTALWVTIGFVLVLLAIRKWPAKDASAWASVVAAAYLFAWLISYHTMFGLRENLTFAQVWPQARYWLAAVAPASMAIGLVADSCRRNDRWADAFLAVPFGWSIPEAFWNLRFGWSHIFAISIPTLLVGLAPLGLMRRRKWSPATFALATLVVAAIFYFLRPYLRLDDG